LVAAAGLYTPEQYLAARGLVRDVRLCDFEVGMLAKYVYLFKNSGMIEMWAAIIVYLVNSIVWPFS
jgi:hypothetical protein